MNRQAAEGYDFDYFAGRSGETGRAWVESFRQSGHQGLIERAQRALALLHSGEIEPARRILESVAGDLAAAGGSPSAALVVGRWYHGVLAYYHYVLGDLERATGELDRGFESVRASIEAHPFLMSLAPHCMDLRMQEARVARRRKQWRRMHDYLTLVRKMVFGEEPFCVLSNGTPIDLPALKRYFDSLPLDEDASSRVAEFFDERKKSIRFDRFSLKLYSLPNLVNPYSR